LVAARRLIPGERMLPSFLIIGAQRAGTTSVHSYLLQHPAVLPALAKEIRYFDVHYSTRSFGWYRAHFPRAASARKRGGRAVTGEASPDYLDQPAAPRRVHDRLPEAQLIAVLRDPVSRAYSQYQHSVDLGFETLSFEDALQAEPERLAGAEAGLAMNDPRAMRTLQNFNYMDRGIYHKHLARWLEHFPRHQLVVIETERLEDDVPGTMRWLFEVLQLEPFDVGRLARLNVRHYPPIPPKAEQGLREFYGPHNQTLAELLGLEFTWAGAR
jgi:sulfotransferase family protein